MAKPRNTTNEPLVLEFDRTGNPWIDAGIVGIYRIILGRPSYLHPAPGSVDASRVSIELSADRLTMSGMASDVRRLLEQAYDSLIASYYDVSSHTQITNRDSYNFYYDSQAGGFRTYPKANPAGAALVLFDKASRVRPEDRIEWDGSPGRLPASHAFLQPKLDDFLESSGLRPDGKRLLIDTRYVKRPKVHIKVGETTERGGAICLLVGNSTSPGVKASGTAFPLLGGSRSFVNGALDEQTLGWQADFAGKFVPALAFFYHHNHDMHIFFPQSGSLSRISEMADVLSPIVSVEPNLHRNFDLDENLGRCFARRSEVTTAFLHRVFVKLSEQSRVEAKRRRDARRALEEADDDGGGGPPISSRDVYDATQRGGPIGFSLVSAVKKGSVWMARDFRTFRDVVYIARLFERMGRGIGRRDGLVKPPCPPGAVLRALVDHEAKDEARSLTRDRVCEAVLNRQPILHLLERHAFRAGVRSESGKSPPVYPLYQFARLYEVALREGTPMGETYRRMVGVAAGLGDEIGRVVAEAVGDKDRKEAHGRARGALFRLRKTRTIADFMNELARLQFRYGLVVRDGIHDAEVLDEATFEEFRGFCVVAALSRFLSATSPRNPQSDRPS